MNAELWSKEGQERTTLECWLLENGVKFNLNMSIEQLRQLYINKECER